MTIRPLPLRAELLAFYINLVASEVRGVVGVEFLPLARQGFNRHAIKFVQASALLHNTGALLP